MLQKWHLKESFKKLQNLQEIELEIDDKITSIGKPKEIEEIYIPPKKDNKLLMT